MRTRLLVILLALVVTACGDDGDPPARAPTHSTTTDIGQTFRAFAAGGDPPPIAKQVDLYLGNAFTGVVTSTRVTDRKAWATCTEIGTYAGTSCPISPLTVLRRHPAVDAVTRPTRPCLATYGPLPPHLRGLDRTVLVPKHATCATTFAIQLVTDDHGRLVAVSTLLGEP